MVLLQQNDSLSQTFRHEFEGEIFAASGQRTVPHVALQVVVLDAADGGLHGTRELVGGDSKSGELQRLEVGGEDSRQSRV